MVASSPYPTWLEIDLEAVAHNTRAVMKFSGTNLMAVVKANAYGFGSVEIARTAIKTGASWLAVARFDEARVLRQAGIDAPILVFGMVTAPEVDEAVALNVSLTLHNSESAAMYKSRALAHGQALHVHLKVDTGFGRMGVLPEDALDLAQIASRDDALKLEGLYSHLAMADEQPDHPMTLDQLEKFESVSQTLAAAGIYPEWLHLANSAAAFGIPRSRYNLVRVGTALLGMKPFYYRPFPPELRRVLSWKAQLASCKQLPAGWGIGYGRAFVTQTSEWVGVVPVGYADGFRRQAGNELLIQGQRVGVIGRVSCDFCMVRLPHPMPVNSQVAIIGRQGQDEITTDELITRWGTSQADITSNINARVPRVYFPQTS